jgi:hypothetical protein
MSTDAMRKVAQLRETILGITSYNTREGCGSDRLRMRMRAREDGASV